MITDGERYNQVINTWTLVTTEVEEETFRGLAKDRDGFNPIFMMSDSGSRGSKAQDRQLAGMRGLMPKPQKKITAQIGDELAAQSARWHAGGLGIAPRSQRDSQKDQNEGVTKSTTAKSELTK